MTVARVLFLARYRVPHACFALQWDHMLQGIDHTIIATPMTRDELEPVWERYGLTAVGFNMSMTLTYINAIPKSIIGYLKMTIVDGGCVSRP